MTEKPKEKTKRKNNSPSVWKMRLVAVIPLALMLLIVGFLMIAGIQAGQYAWSIDITRTEIARTNITLLAIIDPTQTQAAVDVILTHTSGSKIASDSGDTVTPTSQPCFWNWAYGNVDEEGAAQLDAALQAAGYEGRVRVPEFGEDYICGAGESQTSNFHMMDVSPVITLTIEHAIINDDTALGERLVDLLPIVDSIEYSARIREIEVQFVAGETTRSWRAQYHAISAALEADASANELFQLSTLSP